MHAKGRSGIMHHPSCRLTVVVKELNEDQETQIAKYQSMTFRERSKVKSKLFPHKLIEVTPQWSRRSKDSSSGTLDAQSFICTHISPTSSLLMSVMIHMLLVSLLYIGTFSYVLVEAQNLGRYIVYTLDKVRANKVFE